MRGCSSAEARPLPDRDHEDGWSEPEVLNLCPLLLSSLNSQPLVGPRAFGCIGLEKLLPFGDRLVWEGMGAVERGKITLVA